MRRFRSVLSLAVVATLLVAACAPGPSAPGGAPAGEPRPGGELTYIVASEPPSFDAHRESSYAVLHPVAPHYSLLYRYDPADLTKIVPDVAAAMPEISADTLTWAIKLRQDVKFHDGSQLTAEDVVATYNKIIFPPEGVVSTRRGAYAAVQKVEAGDKFTVVFRLKFPTASFLANLASPWNFIYSAAKLKQDIRFYEKNIMGTGPFTYVEYVKGSHWVGKKNPDYFLKGRPYLDGYRAVFIVDPTAQVNAVRGKQALIEFRGFTPQQRDDLKRALGDEITVQENSWVCVNYVTPNSKVKPFDNANVRRALSLALDRWSGGQDLSKLTIVKDVGGLMRPGGPFAMSGADLEKIAGFSKDGRASKEQAKRLLADAGVTNLSFKLLNRNTPTPYEPVAVWLIDQWRQIGATVTHDVKETSAYLGDLGKGAFDVALDFNCDFLDEPDLQFAKFLSADKLGKGLNRAGYSDESLDKMVEQQSRETDPAKRRQIVWQIERYAMDMMAYQYPVQWWYRIIPHNTRVRGWLIGSNHYTNQDLVSIWLAQ